MNIVAETERLKHAMVTLHQALEDKLEALEAAEPFDEGSAYERWEERKDSLGALVEECESLKSELQLFDVSISVHQLEYGGLKR